LLHRLFGRVDIAHAVWDELNANGRSWPGRDEVARASWIVRETPSNGPLIRALQRDLDRGESESIALAVELGADLILLDEQDGRRLAQQQGLKPMGVVGVLLLANTRQTDLGQRASAIAGISDAQHDSRNVRCVVRCRR
jgi:predicted nucleic acid-binding protein